MNKIIIEGNYRPLLKMQVYIASQMNRPGQICPFRDNYCAALIFISLLDSFDKRLSIIRDTITNGSKITDTQLFHFIQHL